MNDSNYSDCRVRLMFAEREFKAVPREARQWISRVQHILEDRGSAWSATLDRFWATPPQPCKGFRPNAAHAPVAKERSFLLHTESRWRRNSVTDPQSSH